MLYFLQILKTFLKKLGYTDDLVFHTATINFYPMLTSAYKLIFW